ncbi:MAG: hypothetical protein ACM3X7_08680 [Solirubrobacterales bacterium]
MKNFLIEAAMNLIIMAAAYFLFRSLIRGPLRHRLYEIIFSSMSKFVIYIFAVTVIITGLAAYIMYRTRYIAYINIVSPAILSVIIGFLMSTVPTRGTGDEKIP